MIRLEQVRVRAGQQTVLHIPMLRIAAGERVAIVGPNGAGKSTLLRVLCGMVQAADVRMQVLADGQVRVLGREIGPNADAPLTRVQWRALRREVGLVMQGLHLVPRLTARENVVVGALARLRGLQAWRSWARLYPAPLLAEADAALAAVGLADRAHTRTDRLSGGERQKLGLARLHLQRPRLVLADEPTAALDPHATQQACAALVAASAAADQALVTVLHDPALLPALATRVLGVAGGRIRWDLPTPAVDSRTLQVLYGHPLGAAVLREPNPHAWLTAAVT